MESARFGARDVTLKCGRPLLVKTAAVSAVPRRDSGVTDKQLDERDLCLFAQHVAQLAEFVEPDGETRFVFAFALVVEVQAATELDDGVWLVAVVAEPVSDLVPEIVLKNDLVLFVVVLVGDDTQLWRYEPAQDRSPGRATCGMRCRLWSPGGGPGSGHAP